MQRGFHNWKDGTIGFKKHEECTSHKEAVEVMVVLPATTAYIGEHSSHQHASQKVKNKQPLHQIVSSLRYLCRQGLPIRGDGDESDSNLNQLLQLKSESDPNLVAWLKQNENVYTSPELQNELIKVMGIHILRNISKEFQSSPFLTIMADETTDISNEEQVAIVFCRVTDDLLVHEEFVGLYKVSTIEAAIFDAIKDVFIQLNLPTVKVCGQYYDGASAMSSNKYGVSKLINDFRKQGCIYALLWTCSQPCCW